MTIATRAAAAAAGAAGFTPDRHPSHRLRERAR